MVAVTKAPALLEFSLTSTSESEGVMPAKNPYCVLSVEDDPAAVTPANAAHIEFDGI
jgi:hypothetical protein